MSRFLTCAAFLREVNGCLGGDASDFKKKSIVFIKNLNMLLLLERNHSLNTEKKHTQRNTIGNQLSKQEELGNVLLY